MKNKEIEKAIFDQFNEKKPEMFDRIMQQCPKMQESISKESFLSKIKNVFLNKRLSYSFASLGLVVLMAFILIGQGATKTPQVFSTIAIDVNPSVVLEIDEADKIVNVIMNNEDAVIIVGDMDLINVDYNIAVNALIGSMVFNGYLNEFKNSVLISIKSNDLLHEVELMTKVTQTVSSALDLNSIDGSIITQELSDDEEIKILAVNYNVSEAKAELIFEITKIDPRVTVQDLAKLSINDLNLYLESKNYILDNVNKVGNASDLGNITTEVAYELALVELNLDTASVVEFEIDLEQENGIMVYKLQIETDTEKYKVLVDAKDGSIVLDNDDDDDDEEKEFPTEVLSEEAVLVLVLSELGFDKNEISELKIDRDIDNGVVYYNIEFKFQGEDYELDVDALNGRIITNSMEDDGFVHDEGTSTDEELSEEEASKDD